MLGQSHYFYDVLVFLISAVIVVVLFKRLRVSPVLGYLVAGILIGPYTLGIIGEVESTKMLAEMGVVFLLFTIGLSLPLERLQSLGRYVFGLGAAQVSVTAIFLALLCMAFDSPADQALLIGSTLAFSSTAVAMQVLEERGEIAARFGRVTFSVLLFQDLAVVVLLILLPLITFKEGSILAALGYAAIKTSFVLMAILASGRILLRPLFRLVAASNSPELFTATALLVILMTAVATDGVGLSMELGAFLAGILLAGTEYRHQVQADIEPFRGLLLGLFFMTVGMGIDLRLLKAYALEIAGIVALFIGVKAIIIVFLGRFFSLSIGSSIRIASLLAGGGEFVFVILTPAAAMGLLSLKTAQILNVAVALSMALTPFLAMLGKALAERIQREFGINLQAASEEVGDLRGHVIIGGFGSGGQIVARLLTENLIPYVAIDMNMGRVADGRSKGLPVFYGDIRRLEVLRAIGAAHARVAVVSVDHPSASVRTVATLRRHFPHVEVCVRARDEEQAEKLRQAGATVVVPETLEPSLQLASSVLKSVGTPKDEIKQIVESFRSSYRAEESIVAMAMPSTDDRASAAGAEAAAQERG